jgi:hypothetical protein
MDRVYGGWQRPRYTTDSMNEEDLEVEPEAPGRA